MQSVFLSTPELLAKYLIHKQLHLESFLAILIAFCGYRVIGFVKYIITFH